MALNPLELPPPRPLSADVGKKGGLGICLVRKEADDIAYEYKGGENVLTVSFDLRNN